MRVFIIAGELSGDKLGGAVMAALKELAPDVEFAGIGGPLMAQQGLVSRFDMSELSVMGLVEILPKYFHFKRLIRDTAAAICQAKPDILLTIDAPEFCLRVAKTVRRDSSQKIKTFHYVAPSVWAWRPGRAAKMAGYIDHVLALLPFEPPLMQAAGMGCAFVGHPVVNEPVASSAEAAAFRQRHGLENVPLVLALPGSRSGEVGRLAARFGAALDIFCTAHPTARVVVPVAAPVAAQVRAAAASWPGTPLLIDPADDPAGQQKAAAFRAADLALAASGTVSLELAATATPMVIAYDMAWLSRQIISRLLLVDTVTLPSLVTDTRVIPEFIGAACQPEPIAQAMSRVFAAPDAQLQVLGLAMDRLGRGGTPPGKLAALSVLDVISNI
ncbi:MAG: lipid-A-disaccharide synthase [Rhodobacteraceae bacterium]|nr:lipid-A-disaccharide synthase [Paracoccaceae bacterium]